MGEEKWLKDDESRQFLTEMAHRYGTSAEVMWRTVKNVCISPYRDRDTGAVVHPVRDEHLVLFLMVCSEYELNPLMKQMYGFIDKHGDLQYGIPIDGFLKIANRHREFDGIEVEIDMGEDGKPVSATARVWRKDREHPTEVTEYFSECNIGTRPWKRRPVRMLRHKPVKEAIRYSFGVSVPDVEEAREAVAFAEPAVPDEPRRVAESQRERLLEAVAGEGGAEADMPADGESVAGEGAETRGLGPVLDELDEKFSGDPEYQAEKYRLEAEEQLQELQEEHPELIRDLLVEADVTMQELSEMPDACGVSAADLVGEAELRLEEGEQ